MILVQHNLFYNWYEGDFCYRETKKYYKFIENFLDKLSNKIYSLKRKKTPHALCYCGWSGKLIWYLSNTNQILWLKKISKIKRI